MVDKDVHREETSRGIVWTWSDPVKSFVRMKYKFEYRDDGNGTVLILCQDGVWGQDDVARSQGDKLLDLRWNQLSLIDYIFKSPDFAAGRYKASFKAAFNWMDKEVKKMADNMGKASVDWSEKLTYSARYNTFALVLSGNKLYMAGGGGFEVHSINPTKDVVSLISSKVNFSVARSKVFVSLGLLGVPEGSNRARDFIADCIAYANSLSSDEQLFFYTEHILDSSDECIVIEVCSPHTETGEHRWLALHEKDWGSTLSRIANGDWSLLGNFDALLLELRHPENACNNSQVPPSATSWSSKKRRAKRQKPLYDLPTSVPMVMTGASSAYAT